MISVKNINLSYDGKEAFEGLNFDIKPEETLGIVGRSGAGKSTILNLISGVLKPDSGEILHSGEITVAYMWQSMGLLPWKTVAENMELPLKIAGGKTSTEIRAEVLPFFAEFGLAGFEDKYPSALSGGMEKRAIFLRAALQKSNLLLLDEPFSSLDTVSKEDIESWFLQYKKLTPGLATVLVSHDMGEVLRLCDRIIVIGERPAKILREFSVLQGSDTREIEAEIKALIKSDMLSK